MKCLHLLSQRRMCNQQDGKVTLLASRLGQTVALDSEKQRREGVQGWKGGSGSREDRTTYQPCQSARAFARSTLLLPNSLLGGAGADDDQPARETVLHFNGRNTLVWTRISQCAPKSQ